MKEKKKRDRMIGLTVMRKTARFPFTQEELANKLGVSRVTINLWETGRAYPRPEHMEKICKLLNCTTQELYDKR